MCSTIHFDQTQELQSCENRDQRQSRYRTGTAGDTAVQSMAGQDRTGQGGV